VTIRAVEDGWDSLVLDVDDAWIVRIPRRPEIEALVRVEARLLEEIAPRLPVAVPTYELAASPAFAYRKLHGRPLERADPELALELGEFLSALHAVPADCLAELGVHVDDTSSWRDVRRARVEEFCANAVPHFDRDERAEWEAFLRGYVEDDDNFRFAPALIHGDLGPEHVLTSAGRIVGVIDWTDARVGDPALDFAWPLHGLRSPEILEAYGGAPDDRFAHRARFHHVVAPLYDVLHGLEHGDDDEVARGVAGARERYRQIGASSRPSPNPHSRPSTR
jgi:aminoglycoside phosphotransferase (APT) family kinase protein